MGNSASAESVGIPDTIATPLVLRLRAGTRISYCVSAEGETYHTVERVQFPPAIQTEAADRIEALEEELRDCIKTLHAVGKFVHDADMWSYQHLNDVALHAQKVLAGGTGNASR